LSAPTSPAIDELGSPIYEREKIPGEQAAYPIDRSQRRARAPRAERRSAAGFSRRLLHHDTGDELSFHRQVQAHQITNVKKKLKVLVLFDGVRPTKIDEDLSEEMKTEDWQTEANVMTALGELGHTAEHLAIFDEVDRSEEHTSELQSLAYL